MVPPPEVVVVAPPPPPCGVEPLAPIEDGDSLLMENNAGSPLNLEGLTPRTSKALSRFEKLVESHGGTFMLTSAYRPVVYQAHLRSVWFKWMNELKDNQDPACAELRVTVGNEFVRHGLLATQYPATMSDHTLGIGFDAAIVLTTGKRSRRARVSLDRLARLSGVQRPAIKRDPVHFRLIGGRG
jgi:hypothetical protein